MTDYHASSARLEQKTNFMVTLFPSVADDFILTKGMLREGVSAMDPRLLDENVDKRVSGDLERTEITAEFKFADGSSKEIKTGPKPTGKDAIDKAEKIHKQIRLFLGLSENEEETIQCKLAFGMFSQFGMGATGSMITDVAESEHAQRSLEITRDGKDVLVRARNDKYVPAFDFTVRIRPDGSNCYESLLVQKAPTQDSRFKSGFLTPDDIKELNTNPIGKGSVTARFPNDVQQLKDEFEKHNTDEIRNKTTEDKTFAYYFKDHYTRSFEFVIGGKKMTMPPPPRTNQSAHTDKEAQKLADELKDFFAYDPKLMNVLDSVVGASLSIFEYGHMKDAENNVTTNANFAKDDHPRLSLSKNPDGSYRVSYQRRTDNPQSYTYFDGENFRIATPKKPGVPNGAFYEYTMTFDMRMDADDQVQITPVGLPTTTFNIPGGTEDYDIK